MSGVAVVVGLCALSFAAGCVLTAFMLRRDQPPEPVPQPAPAPPMPLFEPQFPPEDYATKPIHRNPVMGIPTALPAPERPIPRPNLVAVPDPVSHNGKPARQDEVRRMHVVRTEPADAADVESAEPVPEAAESAEPAETAETAERAETADLGERTEPADPAETVEPDSEPGSEPGSEASVEPTVIQVVARPEPVVVPRAFEAARRESNR